MTSNQDLVYRVILTECYFELDVLAPAEKRLSFPYEHIRMSFKVRRNVALTGRWVRVRTHIVNYITPNKYAVCGRDVEICLGLSDGTTPLLF